ncbi:M23 family metallopeptidase [Azospirillum sp. sgz301742]
MIRTAFLAAASLLLVAHPAAAAPPSLELPIDCTMGEVCVVQNYVDHDPGPGRQDYGCGPLTYDGHDGTDIRLPDYVMMEKGVAVLAAAPGTVLRVRDGMEDVNLRVVGREAIKGREAGNAIVVDHGDGWETWYVHLKRGSVAVKPGQRVETGQKLGLVGLSGATEFPHVHFGVKHAGKPVDPFVGEAPFTACGQTYTPLWSEAAAKALAYKPTAGLGAGFAVRQPDAEAARRGEYAADAPTPDAGMLVLWTDLMGVKAGDMQRVRIEAADGHALFDHAAPLPADKVVWFSYQGVKRPAGGWPKGPYRGTVTLTRGAETVVKMERTLAVP